MRRSLTCVALVAALLSACGTADENTSGPRATSANSTAPFTPSPGRPSADAKSVKACATFESMSKKKVTTVAGSMKIYAVGGDAANPPVNAASRALAMAADKERNGEGSADWDALIKDMRVACATLR
jgi:ABC-type Fe3+-hydroxamate transport system substrate-binding protein